MRQNPFRRIKLVFRRSSRLTKIVVAVALVLSIIALIALHCAIKDAQDQLEDARGDAVVLEQEKSRLERYIEELGTSPAIIRIAQEKLGLVEPDTVVIQPE